MLKLHAGLIKATRGCGGVRDEGMQDLALNNPFQTFGGKELYPNIQAKEKDSIWVSGDEKYPC